VLPTIAEMVIADLALDSGGGAWRVLRCGGSGDKRRKLKRVVDLQLF
jgi:hypothetical protein